MLVLLQDKPRHRGVAKQAYGLVGTVSNIFNRPLPVSEEMRQKLRKVIYMLGFVPYSYNRVGAREQKTIGQILPLSNNPIMKSTTKVLKMAPQRVVYVCLLVIAVKMKQLKCAN